jgi:hypothetical protein
MFSSEKEINTIISFINRRSQSQEKLLLYNLTTSALIFSVVLQGLIRDNSILLIIPVVSFLLYLLWIDHAITIAALEKYLKNQSIIGWYFHREDINKQKIFILKKYVYNCGVGLGFIGPSIISIFIYTFRSFSQIAVIFLILGILLTIIQLSLLFIWRKYSKELYG